MLEIGTVRGFTSASPSRLVERNSRRASIGVRKHHAAIGDGLQHCSSVSALKTINRLSLASPLRLNPRDQVSNGVQARQTLKAVVYLDADRRVNVTIYTQRRWRGCKEISMYCEA